MAGNKETPRQKLINLMYLVLLAMLALQVSSVIIEKFQQLNTSLESSIHASSTRNGDLLQQIKAAVANAKNAADDVKVQKAAEELRSKTLELLDYLSTHKQELVTMTGGLDELGNFNGAKEEEPVANYMLGPGDSKSGIGYELQDKLNSYATFLNELAKTHKVDFKTELLALDGKEDPVFQNKPEQRGKDFAHLNFEGSPLVAALAVISEKGNKVLALESELLSKLAVKVGAKNIPIDKVRPVVLTGSNKLLAGTEFSGEMFMAAYSSNYTPEMTFETNKIEVDTEGKGKIKFRAQGGNYDANGMLKKTWRGTIKYPKPGGGDSTYQIEYEYYVMKPVIEDVSSISAQLYKDCGNEITLKVPGLGADYNPNFQVTGARLRQTGTRGKVIIIPSDPVTEVKLYNDGIYLGSKSYKVKLIPKPDIIVKCDNREVDPVRGIPSSALKKVEIIPIPNSAFKQTNPSDARYRTTSWKAELVRNGRVVASKTFHEQEANLRSLDALPNDIVIISEVKVKRKNFEDNVLDVDIGKPVYIIRIQ